MYLPTSAGGRQTVGMIFPLARTECGDFPTYLRSGRSGPEGVATGASIDSSIPLELGLTGRIEHDGGAQCLANGVKHPNDFYP